MDDEIRAGMLTESGLVLSVLPSLDSFPEIKFAVFDDIRFYDPNHYRKFFPFIPQGFDIVGPPQKNQNCFAYALGKDYAFDRWAFLQLLNEESYKPIFGELSMGDIVAYYNLDPDINGYGHAAQYVGNGRVRSRWGISRNGFGSPIIEHPIDEVSPLYQGELGVMWTKFRKA